MTQKISSSVALVLIFGIAGTIGLLLWLGNERGMRVDDPRIFDFEKPGGGQNWLQEKNKDTPGEGEELGDQNFCAMDAKECPDGSFVGRNADNNCEFDPCPGEDIKKSSKTEVDVNDWKTHRNEELGIEFKYPSWFTLSEVKVNAIVRNKLRSHECGIDFSRKVAFINESNPEYKVIEFSYVPENINEKIRAVYTCLENDNFDREILFQSKNLSEETNLSEKDKNDLILFNRIVSTIKLSKV